MDLREVLSVLGIHWPPAPLEDPENTKRHVVVTHVVVTHVVVTQSLLGGVKMGMMTEGFNTYPLSQRAMGSVTS